MKLENITLPSGIQWEDEYNPAVAQDYAVCLDGSLVYRNVAMTAGRKITLKSVSDGGWVTRATLDALLSLANNVDAAPYTLELRTGVVYTVIFDHKAGGLTASPIFPTGSNPLATTYYMITMNFITGE